MMCHSPCACFLWSLCVLWIVAVGGRAWGEEPDHPPDDVQAIWSEDLPRVETRISWAMPAFLSGRWWNVPENDGSVSLEEPRVPPEPVFGEIDWLSHPVQRASETSLANVFEFGTVEGGLASSWLNRPPADEDGITLVRGGFPRLFGARGRLRAEYGDEFDDVKRIRGQALLSLTPIFGIDASVNSWEDRRPAPKGLGDFWTGDANFVYSMGAQRIAMRGGVGASWVYDSDWDVGYNFTYGADVFLTRPWLISGEVDYGRINRDKLFHWRATFGVQLLRFELYVGYDSYDWNHIRFDGPVAGAGVWF